MFGLADSPTQAALWTAFLVASAIVAYVYAGYPPLLALAIQLQGRGRRSVAVAPLSPSLSPSMTPSVSLIIPAYNEASVIARKLENSLAIDYPAGLLEIIVASDGSLDETNAIVEARALDGVVLRALTPRQGKASALNRTIPEARGDVVVLCDANVMFRADAVRRLVRHFDDPEVGAVTGDVRISSEDAPFGEGEGLFYKYERFLQLSESRIGSTVTVDGGLYAIRKRLFRPLPPDTILDDFVIGMNVALAGQRVVYDPSAVASENATVDVAQEFRRKVRIVAGAFRELLRGQGVPGPGRPQLFWSYVSHKLLRWLVPWFLALAFASSLALVILGGAPAPLVVVVGIQAFFYSCALVGATRPNARWPAPIGIPFYFCMVNAAAMVGSVRGLAGIEQVTWKKASR